MTGITTAQRDTLSALAPLLDAGTYLAGGVAAAIRLNHRISLDLDLFVPADFDEDGLSERITSTLPGAHLVGRARGTVHLEVDAIPISVLAYRYPMLVPPAPYAQVPVPVASPDDLVCMKLSAIAGRGAAKDFWDLDLLLSHGATGASLQGALDAFSRKYRSEDIGHVVRSLAYFADADAAPLPAGLEPAGWENLKARMLDRVRAL